MWGGCEVFAGNSKTSLSSVAAPVGTRPRLPLFGGGARRRLLHLGWPQHRRLCGCGAANVLLSAKALRFPPVWMLEHHLVGRRAPNLTIRDEGADPKHGKSARNQESSSRAHVPTKSTGSKAFIGVTPDFPLYIQERRAVDEVNFPCSIQTKAPPALSDKHFERQARRAQSNTTRAHAIKK